MIGAEVYLWGTKIGTVVQETEKDIPRFMYDMNFTKSNIEISPIMMPLSKQIYTFPELKQESFRGLPGLLADSLPDKFGTRLINEYLAKQGRTIQNLTSVERLCYLGNRGMGALEYVPQLSKEIPDQSIDIDDLAKLADRVLSERKNINIKADENALEQLIKVGTSAGGARAKALIAWNEEKEDIRSGQIDLGEGYSYWLLKFGNIENNKDKDKESDIKEYTKIEYAYSLMAKDARIHMTECRMISTNDGVHFATKRFDREEITGRKVHMQTLGGIAHFDYNDPGAHSYEQAAAIMRKLKLSQEDIEQLFRRMVFNEIAKNYDDHVKNISFFMSRKGKWSLSPAYDMTFSYNPNSIWTSKHQMKINGKSENIDYNDLLNCAKSMDIGNKKAKDILEQVIQIVKNWPLYANEADLSEKRMLYIQENHNTDLSKHF